MSNLSVSWRFDFVQRSHWAVNCRRNCFEIVSIWQKRLVSIIFLTKIHDHFVFLFMILVHFGQRSHWTVYCRRNCFEMVKIWQRRCGSIILLTKILYNSVFLFMILVQCNIFRQILNILGKSLLEKKFQFFFFNV